MSTEQRENLEAILRRSAFPAVPDVDEQRRQLKAFLSAQQTAGIRTIPVLELRRAWPTLLRRAGEVLVTFEEYTRHIDWSLTVGRRRTRQTARQAASTMRELRPRRSRSEELWK